MNIKTDELIKNDVIAELRWDTRVNETGIGVTVSKGVVTLTGAVTSYARKLAAQEAAHRVAGVLDVANDIQVIRSDDLAFTDTEIARAVRHTLEWDVFVPDRHIRSTVSDGWVTLEGEVETYGQREDADPDRPQHCHADQHRDDHLHVVQEEPADTGARFPPHARLPRQFFVFDSEKILRIGVIRVGGIRNSWLRQAAAARRVRREGACSSHRNRLVDRRRGVGSLRGRGRRRWRGHGRRRRRGGQPV